METGEKLPALAVIMVLLMVSCVIDGGGGIGKGGIDKGGGSGTAYTVTVSQPEHGTVRASPLNGAEGTTVTLGNTPNIDYQFSHYTVNNVKIDGNTFNLNGNVTVSGVFPYAFKTPELYRSMKPMDSGEIIIERTVKISPFNIARYETTYELWKEVYDWAIENGYSFTNPGEEGYPYSGDGDAGKGTDNSADWTPEQKKTRPVTNGTWRDAIVWCNAYSQMSERMPVYYTDASLSTVLKTSTNDDADKAVMKAGADGYRLPTEAEWEYAARGGDPSAPEWGYRYAGTDLDITLRAYAWYNENSGSVVSDSKDYGAHPVGTLRANSAGLYDMSGNVREWCWDWYGVITPTTPDTGAPEGEGRVCRGGSWEDFYTSLLEVKGRNKESPGAQGLRNYGFRVACSQ